MKLTLLFGFLLGIGTVLAGAGLYPIVDHARIESLTTVALNGGREETFLIRLPVDRVTSVGTRETGSRGSGYPTGLAFPEGFAERGLLIEHFKLRDVENNVIGLASRHWTESASGAATVWSLNVPGRGAIAFAGAGESAAQLDAALGTAGLVPGIAWSDENGVTLEFDQGSTQVINGASEFRGVQGIYREIWTITGVSATGELRGTIEFHTRVSQRL
jgi:hypothetical protein